MAAVNKLSIRGVRSFSPEDQEQVVEFFFPCTIIVGANGCGKTTIIESLKYAVSGALPPGNKSGQTFVHDPRSVGQSVVKANVKLRFTNRASAPMVVVRSMEVTQKRTNMSFKQLDGVLRTMDPNTGERVSLSHKCTELDRQIPSLLGVSKAVLEHVLFCHQEDASWPLQEGAVLKKRFDDIFDSARYSKALDSFKKTKKELSLKAKDLKADLNGLASHKHAAKGFRKELDDHNDNLEELEDKLAHYRQDVRDAQEEVKKFNEIFAQMEDVRNEIDFHQNELERMKSVADKQRTMLDEDLTQKHDAKELAEMLRDFDASMRQQVQQKEEMERSCKNLQDELEALRKQELDLSNDMAKAMAAKEAQEKRMKERYSKMEAIAQTYSVDLQLSMTQTGHSMNLTMASQSSQVTQDDSNENDLLISNEDMRSFFQSLEKKEEQLKDDLKRHKARVRAQEDDLQTSLTELLGKKKSIENERRKLSDEQTKIQRELQTLSTVASSGARIRQSDIEEVRRNAKKFAKDLEAAANDPRRNEIPVEIRSLEEKIDRIKRQVEDDQLALRHLRRNAETENSIGILKEQCRKDLEALRETLQEQSYAFSKFNIPSPANVEDDDMAGAIETLLDKVHEKHETERQKLEGAKSDQARLQQFVSQNSGVLSHRQQTLGTLKTKINAMEAENGSVVRVRRLVQSLKDYEGRLGYAPDVDERNPQDLLEYMDERLKQIEESSPEGDRPETVPRTIKKLKNLAKVRDEFGNIEGFVCPCCQRNMEANEVKVFQETMKVLADPDKSPLVKVDVNQVEEFKAMKSKFQRWKKIAFECMNDVLDYHRTLGELAGIEPKVQDLEEALKQKQKMLGEAELLTLDLQGDVDELRELLEASKRWSGDVSRVAEKTMQISQKQDDLSMSTAGVGGRDLKTVERALSDSLDEKDNLTTKINRLNKEMTAINNHIAAMSTRATRTSDLAREKEAKFAQEQEASERKKTLGARVSQIAEEDSKLQEQLPPIQQKISTKESEKTRLWTHSSEEETRLNEAVNKFTSDVKNLQDLEKQIEEFVVSKKVDDMELVASKVERVEELMTKKKERIRVLQPDLEALVKAVNDQERHKKLLNENLDLLRIESKIKEAKEKAIELEGEIMKIDGHETCEEDSKNAIKKKQRSEASIARYEGRRSEIVEQIRALKRKLMTAEYKDIDERYRVAIIKHETTHIAANDLDKYANALDKALLRFHSIKIAEINKIIKEVWLLTYKGEDITNIELVSGQEAGSRAAKSYNYRVVMTKGNTKLDMRGRCSAGQRVLASIVIRLALAETFGVHCGCIALDEPTVNLDFNNKRGLAVALAQIIASRAQQRNFQLILITHDEDFVGMMKTELATQTGFPMPEKYFQVRREMAPDGKFYSKIDSVDWDELL